MFSKTLVQKLVVVAGALTILGAGTVAFADEHGPFYARALGMKGDAAKITVTPAFSRASTPNASDPHKPFGYQLSSDASVMIKSAPTRASTSNASDPHKPFGYQPG